MGCTSRAKLICAAPGVHVSRSLSRSRLPPEDAVTVRCALPGLIPASESLSGKPNPGGVQACVDGSSAWSAAASACPVGALLGLTVGGPLKPAGVHAPRPGTLMQPWRPSVQTPSTFPSMSQASPSAHVSLMPGRSLQATKQSVADGPPPATQSGGQPAPAAGASTRTNARATGIRIAPQPCGAILGRQSGAAERHVGGAERSLGELADVGRLQTLGALRDL